MSPAAEAAFEALVGGLAKVLGSLALANAHSRPQNGGGQQGGGGSLFEALASLRVLTVGGAPQGRPHVKALQKH